MALTHGVLLTLLNLTFNMREITIDHYLLFPSGDSGDPGQPHPLPMPEFGGWFAPLTEFLPDPTVPIPSYHR